MSERGRLVRHQSEANDAEFNQKSRIANARNVANAPLADEPSALRLQNFSFAAFIFQKPSKRRSYL